MKGYGEMEELIKIIGTSAPALLPVLAAVLMVLFVQDRWQRSLGELAKKADIDGLRQQLTEYAKNIDGRLDSLAERVTRVEARCEATHATVTKTGEHKVLP